jgi:hypothetical protein
MKNDKWDMIAFGFIGFECGVILMNILINFIM